MFEQIERLKREYTDKYVVVDAKTPELARFGGQTGQVKTVNMSGRALVQFDADNNIGWFDIGIDYLKVVPKPEPKPEAEKKPKSEKPQTSADSPAVAPNPVAGGEKAATAKAPAAGGEKKPSVAEMLRAQAAAKAGGGAPAAKEPAANEPAAKAPAAPAAPAVKVEDAGLAATGEIPAQEKAPEKKPEEAKPAGEKKKLTTAEILASLKKKP
jgi:hypothetical protein